MERIGEIFVAILIFLFGFTVKYFVDFYERKRELSRIKEDFVFEINLICESMPNQSKVFGKLSEQFRDTEYLGMDVHLEIGVFMFYNSIKNFNRSDVHRIFLKGPKETRANKRKLINNIFQNIEVVRSNLSSFNEYLTKHEIHLNELVSSIWDKNITAVQTIYNKYGSKSPGKSVSKKDDEFLFYFVLATKNLHKMNDFQNVYITFERYVKPLQDLCVRFGKDERALEFVCIQPKVDKLPDYL